VIILRIICATLGAVAAIVAWMALMFVIDESVGRLLDWLEKKCS
jgi:hypothetical protein